MALALASALSTNQRTGYHDSYQDQKRYKPQVYINMSYFQDGWMGSHDFKIGYDWKRDRRNFFQDQPFDIFYRDQGGAVNQVDLYNAMEAFLDKHTGGKPSAGSGSP